MLQWWESLSVLQQIFLGTAAPFTLVLLIQTVTTLFGLGGADVDADAGLDAGSDLDADVDIADAPGFRFFSIQGIVAFFCLFGWTGYVLSKTILPDIPVILLAAAAGFCAMLLLGYLFKAIRRLQSSGSLKYSNAVGKTAEVYIPIPPKRSGRGKVMVTFQQRLTEAEAITDAGKELRTGQTVRVVGHSGNTLIVE